ncbi:MAG TPA: adenylate/guanylate cyclase domain-containing protein [Bacteroidales bacterium]|nr:tetratricopeptide repeat protein [Bacteroidales bacterium]HNZ42169.1 adenylate/guanylate cyclase domain-containing protein [Bacteroidales bacterium]HPB25066.1 adenylate/guanylate cyclase domain-containing protein [Bacteroidales bacterium]HPI30657.1 adenylate/guanylate cyclase domain-containing protein [Bacteroidales bacterium]HQN16076.1 adenylate/guanylate cyclase domain-containing protein [Bacteroidales bacterium]
MKIYRQKLHLFQYKNGFLLLILLMGCVGSKLYAQKEPLSEIQKIKKELPGLSGLALAKQQLVLSKLYLTISADTATYYAEEALKLSVLHKDDTLTGRANMSLGFLHMLGGRDSLSIYAFNKASALFKKNNDSINLAWNYMLTGQYYYYQNNYTRALANYHKSLDIYLDMKDPQLYSRLIAVLVEISYVYSDMNDFKTALFYLDKALKIAEVFDDKGDGTSNLFTSIGSIYFDMKQYDKSREYYTKAYKLNKKTGDNKGLAYSLYNLGRVYFETGKHETAFHYHQNAADIFNKINDKIGIAATETYIGKYYMVKEKYATALNYFNMALSRCMASNQQSSVATLFYEMGKAKYHMRLFPQALKYSKRSLSIAQEIHYNEYVYKNYQLMSDIYAAGQSYKEALELYKNYVLLKDSIYNADFYRQMSDSEDKYQAYKKQKEIELLKQREVIQNIEMRRHKILQNSSLLVTALFALLVFVVLRSNRQKRRDNRIIASERDRSNKLLINILPEETAEELKKEGVAKTRYYDLVSVLFTDFKGFTAVAEKMPPEQLVAELDYCFKAYDAIIEKYNVEKIKTIGDSYMCAGGLPVANTTNPYDVVRCGIEICEFMKEYRLQRLASEKPYFEVRIGVHTGPVISGIVGTKKFAYDIWGDTVNTASRMESSGVTGTVNISGSTYEYIKNDFKCTYRGKIEAKNKGLIDMYLVEPLT